MLQQLLGLLVRKAQRGHLCEIPVEKEELMKLGSTAVDRLFNKRRDNFVAMVTGLDSRKEGILNVF